MSSSRAILKPTPSDTIVLSGGVFRVNDQECSTLILEEGGDSDWGARQNLSLDSYAVQHVAREIDPDSLAVYRLFGAYINAAAYKTQQERPLVLDVGCGIFPRLSPGLEQLDDRCQYVGLDPLPHNMERSYPFVCGRIEDLASLSGFAPRFNLFVFGTSLDHLKELGSAAAAVRRLAAPGALLVCWNGLQEPEKVVCSHGVKVFQTLVRYRSLLAAMFAYAGYGLIRLPRLLTRMRVRRDKIAKAEVIDHHFRWFTEANTLGYLSEFGDLIDMVVLPNTNNSFATVRIENSSVLYGLIK